MRRFMTSLFVGAAALGGLAAPSAFADPTPSVGKFCSKDQEGKSATGADGASLTCTKGPGGKDRWTPSTAPSEGTASAGKFCTKAQEGKTANASDGTTLTCTKGDDGKDRWTK
jgi:hypothetical protein